MPQVVTAKLVNVESVLEMPKSPSLIEPSAEPSSARKTLAALRVRCRVRHREPASSAYGCSLSNTDRVAASSTRGCSL